MSFGFLVYALMFAGCCFANISSDWLCLFRFVNLFLLPRIRDDIAEYKRLNFHLYQVQIFGAVLDFEFMFSLFKPCHSFIIGSLHKCFDCLHSEVLSHQTPVTAVISRQ